MSPTVTAHKTVKNTQSVAASTTVTPGSATRKPSPTPKAIAAATTLTPTLATSANTGVYRAFTAGSWWNTPMPSGAPIDASSDAWRALIVGLPTDAWMKLTIDSGNAQAICWPTSSDPLYTIDPSNGPTVTVRIPVGFQPGNTSFSAKILTMDLTTNQGVQLFGAAFSAGHWTATGTDRFYLSSEGIDEGAGGTAGNSGHRGATSVTRAPRKAEVVAGAISHRIQCFIPPALTGTANCFPMVGSDGGNASGPPEGTVMRIKRSVNLVAKGLSGGALVVATCLQQYGCMIADGGAQTAATIRMEREDWSGTTVTKDALNVLTWSDWEFIQRGYQP